MISDTTEFAHWGFDYEKEYKTMIELTHYKLQLEAFCGYGESKAIAEKRVKAVYDNLVAHGWPQENLEIVISGKKDLFICEYCDGCHFAYLHGRGYTISKSYMRSKSKVEKEVLAKRRQCVKFSWVHVDE